MTSGLLKVGKFKRYSETWTLGLVKTLKAL